MKMLKKIVSCAMAAVLSLSMLTACGGGGGGSSLPTGPIDYKNSKLAVLSKQFANSSTATVAMRETESDETGYTDELIIISGSKYRMERSTSAGESVIMLCDGKNVYVLEVVDPEDEDSSFTLDDKIAVLVGPASEDDLPLDVSDMFPGENEVTKIVAGSKDGYYTEEVTAVDSDGDSETNTFYYSGNSLKFVTSTDEGVTYKSEITTLFPTADETKLSVPKDFYIVE